MTKPRSITSTPVEFFKTKRGAEKSPAKKYSYMNLVKNLSLLHLTPDQMQTLETRAQLHRRYSSIEFKILEANDNTVAIRITQDKSHAGNYFDPKRLVEITHETFDDILSQKILVRPIPYKPPVTEVVTADWVKKKRHRVGKK